MLTRIASDLIPPARLPLVDCCYCWYVAHPDEPFPSAWSSTICAYHQDWQIERLAAARRRVNFVLVETPEPAPLYFPFVDHCNSAAYPANWSRISWKLRRVCGFRCEWCGSSEQVSVHHMGSSYPTGRPSHRNDKFDCRRENLYVLCGCCHRWIEQHLRDLEKKAIRKHRALGVGVGLVVVK